MSVGRARGRPAWIDIGAGWRAGEGAGGGGGGVADVDDDDGGERDRRRRRRRANLPSIQRGNPTQPTQMDIAQFSNGPDEQCDRDEKSTISKVALRIGDGRRESEREDARTRLPLPRHLAIHSDFSVTALARARSVGRCVVHCEAEKMRPKEN